MQLLVDLVDFWLTTKSTSPRNQGAWKNNCQTTAMIRWSTVEAKKPRPKNIIPTPSDSLKDLGVKEILNEIILFLICLPKRKEVHKQNHGPVKEKVRHSTSFYSGFPWFIYIKNVGFKGVGSVVRIETSRGFFVIRSVLHRCQAAQRKKSPICHPHLGNGLLQRFLLTIETVDLSKSPWVCFHWVSIGGTLDVTTTPPPIFPGGK